MAGRGIKEQLTDACGAAEVVKVYCSSEGASLLVSWKAVEEALIDKSGKPKDAKACQALCAANADCKFFTYSDQNAADKVFEGACILHKALSCSGAKYSLYHGSIAGPASCSSGSTTGATAEAATTTAGASDASFAQTSRRLVSLTLGASLSAFLLA